MILRVQNVPSTVLGMRKRHQLANRPNGLSGLRETLVNHGSVPDVDTYAEIEDCVPLGNAVAVGARTSAFLRWLDL